MMMKSNLKADKKRTRLLIGVFAILCVIVLILNFFAPALFSGVVVAVGRPIWPVSNFIGDKITGAFSFFTSGFQSKAALISERDSLKAENSLLQAELAERDVLAAENANLKSALGRSASSTSPLNAAIPSNASGAKLVYASVLLQPAFAGYDTLIIDAGTNQRLKEGNRVLLADGIMIGRIEQANSASSRVILLSNPDTETPIIIGNASSTILATAIGRGSGNFEVKLPKTVSVHVGESIRIAGTNNVAIASVEVVQNDAADSFEELYFKLPIEPNAISGVFVDPTLYDDIR